MGSFAQKPLLPASLTRHIFLQGEKGCGKTSLIKDILAQLDSKVTVGGFFSTFNTVSDKEKTLHLSSLKKETHNHIRLMHWLDGAITIYREGFETHGTQILQEACSKDLIIMDELGRFEQNCEKFKHSVFKCLNEMTPVLGVVQMQSRPTWLDDIKSHPKVTIVHIEEENRLEVKQAIIEHLCNTLL